MPEPSEGDARDTHSDVPTTVEGLFDDSAQVGVRHLTEALEWLRSRDCKRLFLVVDAVAAEASGAWSVISDHFTADQLSRFDRFSVNPQWQDVRSGLRQFHRDPSTDWDAVVAIGGGTAIDVAKLIRGLKHDDAMDSPAAFQFAKPSQPLLVIPTTAGTGSEATSFAVLYVDGVKHSLEDACLLPDVAVVDWRLTRSLPPATTAASGLDALCQAIESLWSVRSTPESSQYARKAMQLAANQLEPAVLAPTDSAREAMAAAAHFSGRAIQISKTTAAHAMSYHLTSKYGLAHGSAVALMFGPVLLHNASVDDDNVTDPRGAAHVRDVMRSIVDALGGGSVQQVVSRWYAMLRRLGCPTTVTDLGLTEPDQFEHWKSDINLNRLANNPVRIGAEEVDAIFRDARNFRGVRN